MKKGKLLLLFALILCMSAFAVACAGDTDVGAEPKQVDHEMHDYLVYTDKDASVFTDVKKLDGECVSFDPYNKIATMKEVDVDVFNNLVEKYKVYNLVNGEVIFEAENASPYFSNGIPAGEEKTTLEVSVEYPVICEKRTTVSVSEALGEDTTYEIAYYAAKKDGELIHETEDEAFFNLNIVESENIFAVELGDKVFFINSDLEIIRSVDSIYENGYDDIRFDAEYQGYLYSWTEDTLYVFNHAGVCSATFTAGKDSRIECFVLNNGKVLLQEHREVGLKDKYDYLFEGDRMVLTSCVIDPVTGETTEIKLDYIVSELRSAYTEKALENSRYYAYANGGFGRFLLAGGKNNKAIMIKIANGSLAKSPIFAVVDNDMNIEYEIKNSNPDAYIGLDMIALGPNMYSAMVMTAGKTTSQIFDLDGNAVCTISGGVVSLTDRYIVTDRVIYDLKMNLVYDAEANGYKITDVVGEKVFLTKPNFITAGYEAYAFDVDKKEPVLIADGVNELFVEANGNCYVLIDEETDVYTVYGLDGTELLSAVGYPNIIFVNGEIMIIETEFNGKTLTYIIK